MIERKKHFIIFVMIDGRRMVIENGMSIRVFMVAVSLFLFIASILLNSQRENSFVILEFGLSLAPWPGSDS